VSAAVKSDVALDRWYADPVTVAQTDVAAPSRVSIEGGGGHYVYMVNGHPEVIQGMGLNTQYASQMSPDERARQLESAGDRHTEFQGTTHFPGQPESESDLAAQFCDP